MSLKTSREREVRNLRLLPYPSIVEAITERLARTSVSPEMVPIDSARGRICAETVLSPVDVPPVSTSAMDGYALRSARTASAGGSNPVLFKVVGTLQPGSKRPGARLSGPSAYYVGTGAPVPLGADAVVKIEEVRILPGGISVSRPISKWKNVVTKGQDVRRGSIVARVGDFINPAAVALLVGVGRSELSVFRRLRVGILSTGDELTSLEGRAPGKKVNNYSNMIAGYLSDSGAVAVPLGVVGDGEDEILNKIGQHLPKTDGIVTLGGSSVGDRDFTAAALRRGSEGVEVFHGIRMVPVRPAGLYLVNRKPVFLLPGHCVAAALSFFLVVKPALNVISGLEPEAGVPKVRARLSDDVANSRPLDALFLAKLSSSRGEYVASPLPWGSDRITTLGESNGFLQVGPRQTLKAGEEVNVRLLGAGEFSRINGGIRL